LTDRITDRQQTKITDNPKLTDRQTDEKKITDKETKIERQTLKETDRHWQSDIHLLTLQLQTLADIRQTDIGCPTDIGYQTDIGSQILQ
jgi:hypothetical protein